jgi:type I restriction enzyme S subunit
MEVKAGFRKSEIGCYPADWQIVLLDDVAVRGTGHTPSKGNLNYWKNGKIKWVSLQDSGRLDKGLIRETAVQITELGLANSSAKIHPLGSVVLSRDAGVGKSAILSQEMAVSQHFVAWNCKKPLLNWYLYYFLQAQKSEFERIAMGNTIKTIGFPYFEKLKIPLPPLPEQQAIANALSDADALIESLEQLIEKKRQIKQGVMQELLTGKRRLPGFSGEWERKKLGDLISLKNGYAFKSCSYCDTGKYRVVTIANVQSGEMKLDSCSKIVDLPGDLQPHQVLKINDFLISMTGNVGRVCFVNEVDCVLNQRVGKIVPINISERFLFAVLNDQAFMKCMIETAKGGAQPNLSSKDINGFEFNLPLNKEEQLAIADVFDHVNSEIGALNNKLQKTMRIKQAMMQELLTGKVRLV